MKLSICLAALFFFSCFSLSSLQAQLSPELREEGVLYLRDNLPEKVTLSLKTSLTIYQQRDFVTAQGQFYPGQTIEVIGLAPEGYLLLGSYRNNTVTGWVRAADLPPGIDPTLFQLAHQRQRQRDEVAAAIANKTAIPGMTPDQVTQALGRPEKTDSHLDIDGSTESWTYVTYREQPQYYYTYDAFHRLIPQCYYVKTPVGQITVSFVRGAVISVAEHALDRTSTSSLVNFPN